MSVASFAQDNLPPRPWGLHQLAKKQGTGTCNIGGGVGENREDPQETHIGVVILKCSFNATGKGLSGVIKTSRVLEVLFSVYRSEVA